MNSLKVLPLLLLTVAMFFYPQEVLKSASTGLSLWVNYLLPVLFPFFIISDLLMKQGFVNFLGVLLEPLMRPLFRLPGKASFIIAMTHTSGIPMGAILTCKMRREGEITKSEGERLLAFTSNPSPGFMFGAVSAGMLGNPALGMILAGSVYLANLIVGFLFRFYGPVPPKRSPYRFSLRLAWREMQIAQQKNNSPIGEIMANAIRESISTILLVGGYVIFFSVITHMLTVLQISTRLAQGINCLSIGLLSPTESYALIQGIFETTLGCMATVPAFSTLNAQIGMLAFLLGWGGLSVFAQVSSFTATTDLRFLPFVIGRTLHSFLALIISQIMLRFSNIPTANNPFNLSDGHMLWLFALKWSTLYFVVSVFFLILLGLSFKMWQKRN